MARAVCKILTGLKQELHLPNIIRKAIARAMEVIQNPEYRDKMDKGFTVFLLEIGTTFPAEIMESSMPYVVQFVDSDVRLTLSPFQIEIKSHLYPTPGCGTSECSTMHSSRNRNMPEKSNR